MASGTKHPYNDPLQNKTVFVFDANNRLVQRTDAHNPSFFASH